MPQAVAVTSRAVVPEESVGELLRQWRTRRRMSQLDLALRAEVSTRHLSFVETGRSRPSAELVIRLCEELDVPLRQRNPLLLAAGHAPAYRERPLDSPALAAVRAAVSAVLRGSEPSPALLVDAHWTLLEANRAVPLLLEGVAPALLEAPVNVLRLSLHPDGMAPRIENLAEWRAHVLLRLRRQLAVTADLELARLLRELTALPAPPAAPTDIRSRADTAVVPLRYRAADGALLSFVSMTAVLGTPHDVTVEELAIESFHPADEGTAAWLRDAVRTWSP